MLPPAHYNASPVLERQPARCGTPTGRSSWLATGTVWSWLASGKWAHVTANTRGSFSSTAKWLIPMLLVIISTQCSSSAGFDLNEPVQGIDDFYGPEPQDETMSARPVSARALGGEHVPMEVDPQQGQGVARCLWRRVRNSIPDYFNFENFLAKYKRQYSKAELALRKAVFLRKVMEIFKSRLEYRLGRKSYREEPNEFSDKTPAEFQMMFQPVPPPEFGSSREEFNKRLLEHKQRLEEETKTDQLLMDVETQSTGSDDGDETERASREINQYLDEQRRELEGERYSKELSRLLNWALCEEMSGMGFETDTRSTATGRKREPLPWPGRLSPPDDMETEQAKQNSHQMVYVAPELDLGQSIDWSEHECFHQVYEQTLKCGNCYVMATTALAEFYACSARGPEERATQRKFSKRFVMDCGQKFSPKLMGCTGGSPFDTLRFMTVAGVNNIRSWTDKRKLRLAELLEKLAGARPDPMDANCPLDTLSEPYEKWGAIKVELTPRLSMDSADWMEALQDGPLVVTVQMPSVGVDSYAGGVHDGQGCADSKFFHTMLLVGYGVSNRNEPYWRFRNSFGPNWGEQGHFHLSMAVPSDCMIGGVRVYRAPHK